MNSFAVSVNDYRYRRECMDENFKIYQRCHMKQDSRKYLDSLLDRNNTRNCYIEDALRLTSFVYMEAFVNLLAIS